MRRALAVAVLLLALATPASAGENPVLDAEGDADVAAALDEATDVQGICYGYELTVQDFSTGQFDGQYTSTSLGAGVPAGSAPGRCLRGVVVLQAAIAYTSEFSEAEDSAAWRLNSSLPELTIEDIERQGLSVDDLLDDGKSETTLLNATLALPRLAAETGEVPPLVLEPNTQALPADARPTGTPGSDWLRENSALLIFFALLIGAGGVLFALSFRSVRSSAGAAGSFLDI